MGTPEGYKTASAIEMGNIKVSVKIGSVLSDTIVVDEIIIQAPQITLEGSLTGKNNISTILNNVEAYGASDQQPKQQSATPAKKTQKKIQGAGDANVMHVGAGTSNICPVAFNLPVPGSMSKTTMLSESWLATRR